LLNTILGSLSGGVAASTSSYESIASATGTGSSQLVTFNSIPSTYKHLQLRWISKDTYSGIAAALRVEMQFNSDTGTNYARHQLYGDGSALTALGASSVSTIRFDAAGAYGTTANEFGVAIVDIIDYASTTKNKTVRGFYGANGNTSNTNYAVGLASGVWLNTNAITSITVISGNSNFTTTSQFALYGIRG
jgi:hypothetical protein